MQYRGYKNKWIYNIFLLLSKKCINNNINALQVCDDFCEETCTSNAGGVLPSRIPQLSEPVPTIETRIPQRRPQFNLQPEINPTREIATRPPICYPNNFDSRCPKETRVSRFPEGSDETENILPVINNQVEPRYTPSTARPFPLPPTDVSAACYDEYGENFSFNSIYIF